MEGSGRLPLVPLVPLAALVAWAVEAALVASVAWVVEAVSVAWAAWKLASCRCTGGRWKAFAGRSEAKPFRRNYVERKRGGNDRLRFLGLQQQRAQQDRKGGLAGLGKSGRERNPNLSINYAHRKADRWSGLVRSNQRIGFLQSRLLRLQLHSTHQRTRSLRQEGFHQRHDALLAHSMR